MGIGFTLSILLTCAFPSVIYASQHTSPVAPQQVLPTTPVSPQQPQPSNPVPPKKVPPIRLENPLKVKTISELLHLILDIVIIFAIPVIVFFIIYSGFLYVTAQGKPDQIKKATTAFTWTIIGAVIVLGAKALEVIITNTVKLL